MRLIMDNKKVYDGKHLSLENRITIEQGISQGLHKSEIAKLINKSPSTVAKEIKRNRKLKPSNSFNEITSCIYLHECKHCFKKCNRFQEPPCFRRDRFVGACNDCPNLKKCKLEKYFYKAKIANQNYLYSLKDSREGVNLTYPELKQIAEIIAPLINQGQSLYTILENHKEIKQCSKTLYTYIEMGLFKDWGITNLSLKRKVKRKIRSKKLKKRNEPANYEGHKYEDYLQFIKDNPSIPTTEMDTVYNFSCGPFIQTFIFEHTGFMIGILHQEKTVMSMASSLDKFQDILQDDYEKLFSLLLTDRGSEFSNPQAFEVNLETGECRSKIFYCDAQQSQQKPHVENNHNFIREILPNGRNLAHLTQEQLDLMFSHINSVPRKSLGGKTPYEAFTFFYGEEIPKKLNIQKIEKDRVTLKPYLLKIK